jgi:hypothetical protein
MTRIATRIHADQEGLREPKTQAGLNLISSAFIRVEIRVIRVPLLDLP